MRRWLALALALIVPLGLLAGFAAGSYRPGLPASARSELSSYLRLLRQTDPGAWTAETPIRASRPWRLTRAESGATFGSSAAYLLDHPASSIAGQRPLPYPPRDAWCVRLHAAQASQPRAVVLALHQDLYNADWVLHELAGASAGSAATLADLGCAAATGNSE